MDPKNSVIMRFQCIYNYDTIKINYEPSVGCIFTITTL